MKSLAILSAILVVGLAHAQGSVAAATAAQGTHNGVNMAEKIFDPARDSAKDVADAIKLATKQNKHILLDVGGNWCIWCHRLDTTFKTNKDVAELLKKFVVVKIDFSPPAHDNQALLANYPKITTGYPHLFVLDKTGKVIQDQDTGQLETGDHHDPAKVIAFLTKWK